MNFPHHQEVSDEFLRWVWENDTSAFRFASIWAGLKNRQREEQELEEFGVLPTFYSSAEGYPYKIHGFLAGTLLI